MYGTASSLQKDDRQKVVLMNNTTKPRLANWRVRGAAIAAVALSALSVGAFAAPAQAYYSNSQQDFQVSTHVQNIG